METKTRQVFYIYPDGKLKEGLTAKEVSVRLTVNYIDQTYYIEIPNLDITKKQSVLPLYIAESVKKAYEKAEHELNWRDEIHSSYINPFDAFAGMP